MSDKSAFELIYFALHERSEDEQRELLIFNTSQKPCKRCGGVHIELFEFFYHYN